jgi:hypothetical protein
MPAGRPICALRASVRRTLDSACIGWPTPKESNTTGIGTRGSGGESLQTAAHLAGWASPTAQDSSRGGKDPRPHDTGIPLSQQAALAGWATPKSEDAESRGFSAKRVENGKTPDNLHSQTKLLLGTWATPATRDYRTLNHVKWSERGGGKKGEQLQNQVAHMIPGASLNGLPAATERCGLLNPAFSLWLQGFPGMWARCAALATRSTRTSRRSSSRHVCK